MRIIRGRKAVVFGAASGIGRAVALALAAEGADLFLVDRDVSGLANLEREIARHGVYVTTAVCNLTNPPEISRTTSVIRSRWRELNILINSAGLAPYGVFHLTPEQAWRDTMAVNLLAPMQIVHELMCSLVEAEEAHIVNICSFIGLVPMKKMPSYQASKFGLVGFTLALRNDYQRHNFGVTALCPGFVRTPMLENATDPEPHRRSPSVPGFFSTTAERVAARTVEAIRRNRGIVPVTVTARLLWWAMRLSPAVVGWVGREGWRRRKAIKMPPASRR